MLLMKLGIAPQNYAKRIESNYANTVNYSYKWHKKEIQNRAYMLYRETYYFV